MPEGERTGRIGEVLVHRGSLTQEQLRAALDLEKNDRRRLGEVLLSQNLVSGEELARAAAEATGFEYVSLSDVSVDPAAVSLLEEKVLRKHGALPLKVEGGRLVLAMSDPTDVLALDDLKTLAGCPVQPVVAAKESIGNLQDRVFGTGKALPEEVDDGPLRPQADDALSISRGDDDTGAPAVRLANSIIRRALSEGASDIHVEPRAEEVVVRCRVDGVLKRGMGVPLRGVPLRLKESLASRFKIMGDLDISM